VTNKARIEEYITKLHKDFKQKTIKRKIASIRAFYNYLEEEEIISEPNPFHRVKVKFKEIEAYRGSFPEVILRNS